MIKLSVIFMRLFYLFTLRCMELAVIMYLCEKHVHARFIYCMQ